ncbi:hypothetical protein ACX1C1_05820 [Paenibacillus sp. strain BS8-2]
MIRKNIFIIGLLCAFLIAEALLTYWNPVGRYEIFAKNDFERTVHAHPEQEWSKVIFGNSSVIASYDEEASTSGYVNLGINYGKLTDLDAMLKKGMVTIQDELVLGLNLFTFMDELPTDPSYGWYNSWYEPYLYFYRDAIDGAIDRYFIPWLKGEGVTIDRQRLYGKDLYYGTLKPDELEQKITEYKEKYYVLTLNDFGQNLKALDNIIRYTEAHDIRLRVMWMPWNPTFESPAYVNELKEQTAAKLAQVGITATDWMDKYAPEQFHDLGHLNVQRGRPLFTKELDQWFNE